MLAKTRCSFFFKNTAMQRCVSEDVVDSQWQQYANRHFLLEFTNKDVVAKDKGRLSRADIARLDREAGMKALAEFKKTTQSRP